jgi:hypothetical protein
LKDYPNLLAILEGRVSGHHTEWPMVRVELARLINRVGELEKFCDALTVQRGDLQREVRELRADLRNLRGYE